MGTNAGELWVKLGLNKKNFESGLKEAQREASTFGGVMKNAFSTMVGFAGYNIGANITIGLKNAVAAGISYNATLENSAVAWTTLLGSQQKASAMLKEIEAFAAKTPFEKMQVDQMAKYMNNAGLAGQELFDQLTQFGDMAGAFNIQSDSLMEMTRQYSQVKQAGVAYTEDLNILADRGVPIYKAIAEQLNVNVAEVKKWASEGKISADIYQAALDNIASGVAGGMDKQSQTFNGMISSAKDGISQIAGLMATDIFEGAKGALTEALTLINNFAFDLRESGDIMVAVGMAIERAFGKEAGNAFFALLDGARIGMGWIKDNAELIKAGVAGLATAFTAYKIAITGARIASEVHNAIMLISTVRSSGLTAAQLSLKAAQGGTTAAQWLLNAAMSANPIGIVILAVTALVGALVYLWKTNEGFRMAVTGLWNGLKNGVGAAMIGIKDGIVNGFNGAIAFITGLPGKATQWGKDIIQGLINGITDKVKAVQEAIKNVTDAITTKVKNLLGIHSPSRVFMEIGQFTVEGLAVGINRSGGMAKDAASDLVSGLVGSTKIAKGTSTQVANNTTTKTTNINIYGAVNMQSKGEVDSTLQQLQFLAGTI